MVILQKTWEELSGKGKWDVQVALRGPDAENSDTMKWFTTSVIRGACSKVMRVGGLVNDSLGFVLLPSGDGPRITTHGFNYHHFFTHVREAAGWLDIPVITIPATVWWKIMTTCREISVACLQVEAYFKEHKDEYGEYSSRLHTHIVATWPQLDPETVAKREALREARTAKAKEAAAAQGVEFTDDFFYQWWNAQVIGKTNWAYKPLKKKFASIYTPILDGADGPAPSEGGTAQAGSSAESEE